MNSQYPTPWQRKMIWSAITATSLVAIGGIGVGLIWLSAHVLSFLQPILIPFAVAGVLAYLLEPVVSKLAEWKIPRRASVLSVFGVVFALLLWGALWLIPVISHQTVNLYNKADQYTRTTQVYITDFAKSIRQKYGFDVLPALTSSEDEETSPTPAVGVTAQPSTEKAPSKGGTESGAPKTIKSLVELFDAPKAAGKEGPKDGAEPRVPNTIKSLVELFDINEILKGDWLKTALSTLANNSITMLRSSVGGFVSVFGFLISLIIIPVYLFYFLIDARHISDSWQDYLPLKNSKFKTEVVSTITEINGYTIAFFRGQLLVSVINGISTAVGLMIVGLDFGLLIGLVLCVLGLVPYLGILICWIPAVIIASVQRGVGSFVPDNPPWLFALVVTGIFVLVQKIDSFYITPKVVEKRVGLHPMTVIVSLFVWSLLIGPLLGTILGVPLTATLKVLLRRYAWERTIMRNIQEPDPVP